MINVIGSKTLVEDEWIKGMGGGRDFCLAMELGNFEEFSNSTNLACQFANLDNKVAYYACFRC